MLNDIITGIAKALGTTFGSEFRVYKNDVKQGLKEPCFSVLCVNPTQKQFLGKRYHKTNKFCIHYFPASAESNAEINTVREDLFSALEYITVDGDLIRGTDMTGETDDLGVLNFFVNYNFFVRKVKDSESMESYDYQNKMKG